MPRAVMVLIVLFMALAPRQPWAGQERGLLDLPVLTSDTPKQCCRACKKGKACGNGSQERQCTKASGCACDGSGSS